MTLENLISRADEDTMQDLLGRDTIRLIRLLNRKDSISTKTKEALIKLHTFEGLLLIKEKRALLFNLLKKPELKKICEALSIPYNELSYEIIQSLHIRRGSVKEKALFDCFGLTPPLKDGITEIPDCENINASYALFTHQIDAAQKVESKLNDYHRRVILHMPTGSGKTRTAMYVIAQHLLKKEGTIVVWLAYSEELCEQAADEFKKAWQSLGNRDLRLHRFWGDHQLNLEKVNDGVLIAGLSKTYSAIRKNITTIKTLASKCSLVIIDEAHQAIAETYSLVLSALFSYNKNTGRYCQMLWNKDFATYPHSVYST